MTELPNNPIERLKELTEKLSERDRVYRMILEQGPFSLGITDEEGKFVYLNSKALDIFGVKSLDEVSDKLLEDFIVEETREKHKALYDSVVKNPGVNVSYEAYVKSKDGNVRICEVNSQAHEDPNIGLLVQNTACDITQLKVNQALYMNLIEHIPFPIYVHEDSVITLVNKSAKIFLRSNGEDLIGKSIYDIVHSSNHPEIKKREEQVKTLKSGEILSSPIKQTFCLLDGTVKKETIVPIAFVLPNKKTCVQVMILKAKEYIKNIYEIEKK